MSIGASIKEYIDEKGIKQAFLVEKAGISQYKVSNILNEKREIKVTEYYLICKALEVPFDKFIKQAEQQTA